MLALTQGRLAEAVEALEATPEVLEVDAVSGPEDLICRVAARDPEHLQEIVNRLLATDAIRHSTSYIVLSRPIRPRVQPLVDAVGGAPSGLPGSSSLAPGRRGCCRRMTDHYEPTRRRLLRDLGGARVGVAGAGLVGREEQGAADAATPSCMLSPEVTEGPFYLDLDNIRRDVTEDKPGLRLDLRIKVVNASTCNLLEHAAVEIWHADAGGTYSGFTQEGTEGKTYLRGAQLTGPKGLALFRTIYPGWYQGRATHIHLKVHVGGRAVHTGQLFFHESVNDRVVRLSPYNRHQGTRLRNGDDDIYRQAGSGSLVRLRRRKADGFRKGLIGTITVGVERE